MAKTDEKVMALVEEELTKRPDISVDELYDKAKSVSRGVGQLTKRQFNARYPLQVKRRRNRSQPRSGGGTRRRRRSPKKDQNREAMRQTLLEFAAAIVAAEERKDLVKLLSNVDQYVDRMAKASGGR